jgi:predicted ATPase
VVAERAIILAKAQAELGQFDDAWRCIEEAITHIETTKERWWEAEVNRIAGEIVLQATEPKAAKAEAYFALTPRRASATSQVLGTPRRHEPRTPLARPGQGAASARTVGSGLRVVYGGVRHARPEGSEGVAGGVGRANRA